MEVYLRSIIRDLQKGIQEHQVTLVAKLLLNGDLFSQSLLHDLLQTLGQLVDLIVSVQLIGYDLARVTEYSIVGLRLYLLVDLEHMEVLRVLVEHSSLCSAFSLTELMASDSTKTVGKAKHELITTDFDGLSQLLCHIDTLFRVIFLSLDHAVVSNRTNSNSLKDSTTPHRNGSLKRSLLNVCKHIRVNLTLMDRALEEGVLNIALVVTGHIKEALVSLRAIPPSLAVGLDGLLLISGQTYDLIGSAFVHAIVTV